MDEPYIYYVFECKECSYEDYNAKTTKPVKCPECGGEELYVEEWTE